MQPVGGQMRFTKEEVDMIQKVFKDNEPLLKLMRKCFIPEIDVNAPVGQVVDFWMDRNYSDIASAEVKTLVVARQEAIRFLETGLLQLQFLANKKDETPDEAEARQRKDSSR